MSKNLIISKLKKGNKILLETKECIFDIEILSPKKSHITICGGRRFIKPTKATIIGVYGKRDVNDEDSLLEKDQIEKNIGLEFQYNDNDNITCNFVTSPILSAKVYGKDWSYEIWDNNDRNSILERSLEEARSRIRINTNTDNNNEGTLS